MVAEEEADIAYMVCELSSGGLEAELWSTILGDGLLIGGGRSFSYSCF